MPMRYRSTKRFWNLPCAHRQHKHKHKQHCRFVHGDSREFKFWFEASELDENNFVVDFAALKELKSWLMDWFDHTVLVNQDDPELDTFKDLEQRGILQLRICRASVLRPPRSLSSSTPTR